MFGLSESKWKELNGSNTAKEIYQQPKLWNEVLQMIKSNEEIIRKFIKEKLNKDDIRVIFSGAGTSAYVGDIVSNHFKEKKNYIFESIATTDIVSNPEMYFRKEVPTLLVSFARSGNSPESVATYELANELIDDISHIFITCNDDGKLANISKDMDDILLLLMPEDSDDKGFAMTSSFSCMTLAALLIFDLDDLEDNERQITEMISIGERIIDEEYENIQSVVNSNYDRIVYLSSSNIEGLTKESALKLLELTRGQIISQRETVLGFRHGPKSIVNDNTIIFVYLSDDEYERKYEIDMLSEIYHDIGKHKLVVISNNHYKEIEDISDKYFYLSKSNNIVNLGFISLLYAIYAQIFALLSSVKVDVEPDNPAPSGLVNRVVKGVKIYKYSIC